MIEFEIGQTYSLYEIDAIGWVVYTSACNREQFDRDAIKQEIAPHISKEDYTITDMKLFKLQVEYWGDFHKERSWISKRRLRRLIETRTDKEVLMESLLNDIETVRKKKLKHK